MSKKLNRLSGAAGEDRPASHVVTLTAEVSVVVEWPEGVPFRKDKLREIVATGIRDRHDTNVSDVAGKIIWARLSYDCRDVDVTIDEVDAM